MQPTAFISHASADAAQASRLAALLEEHDVLCWVAPRDLNPGQPYADEIVRGIQGCAAFILLATTTSLSSPNVLNELEQAHRSSRTLYTVMVNQPKVPGTASYYVARLHWLQTDGSDMEMIAGRLAQVMHGTRRWEAVASPPSLARTVRAALPAFSGAFAAFGIAVLLLLAVGTYLLQKQRHNAAEDYRSLGWTSLESVTSSGNPHGLSRGRVWLGDPDTPFSQTALEVITLSPAHNQQRFSPLLPPTATGQAPFTFALPTDVTLVQTRLSVPSATERATFCVTQQFTVANGAASESGSPKVQRIREGATCG